MPSTIAITAATSGAAKASAITPATSPSSAKDTTTFDTGSGEVLTTALVDDFARWLDNANPTPTAPATAVGTSMSGKVATSQPPIAGRRTVWIASHTLSR